MKVEEGKSYEARNGQKIANMVWREHCGDFVDQGMAANAWWHDDGTRGGVMGPDPLDLIAEWKDEPTGPVTIETVKRINSGTFGRVNVGYPDGTWKDRPVLIAITPHDEPDYSPTFRAAMNASELRAAADVFIQLADALEGK